MIDKEETFVLLYSLMLKAAFFKNVQVGVFRRQLELAKELNKPASIHCVRAFGDLLEITKYDPLLPVVCSKAKSVMLYRNAQICRAFSCWGHPSLVLGLS